MNMTEEIWKSTHIFSDFYEVSNFGRVRSVDRYVKHNTSKTGERFVKGQYLKPNVNHKGYLIVFLSRNADKKTIPIHRLVAMAFIKNKHNYPQINHIDGNKQNNHVGNLEWCNNSMNQIHAYQNGLHIHVNNSGRKKIPIAQFNADKTKLIATYESINDAVRATGISQCGIRKAINKTTKANGIIHEYYFEKIER